MALPWNARLVVLFLYALHASPQLAIVVYLRRKRRQARDDMLLRLAEDALLSASEAELAELVSDECEYVWQRDLARRLLAECAVHEWCMKQNARGVAPTTQQIVQEAGKYAELPLSLRCFESGKVPNAARAWANAWRKRWNVRVGCAKGAAVLDASEFRNKVSFLAFLWVRLSARFTAPQIVPLYIVAFSSVPFFGIVLRTMILLACPPFVCILVLFL